MNQIAVLLVLALAGFQNALAADQGDGLTLAWVTRFEQSFDLNTALKDDPAYRQRLSLDSYSRHYESSELDGVALVNAVYASPIERHPEDQQSCRYRNGVLEDCRPAPQPSEDLLRSRSRGAHIGDPLPLVLDGGCGVVTLWIDPATLRIVGAWCNGEA